MKAIYVLFISFGITGSIAGTLKFDCSKPPLFVDPHSCCIDPPPNKVAKKCAKNYGLPIAGETPPARQETPSIEATVCFADCVMTESSYMLNGDFKLDNMRKDILKEYANDTAYSSVMISAFQKCSGSAQQKFNEIKSIQVPDGLLNGKCSPLAGIILGCSYTEFFKFCPPNRWVSNAQCNTARVYVQNCVP